MSTQITRGRLGWPLLAVAAVVLSLAPPAATAKASPATFVYQGNAYGSSVKVGAVLKSGPSAPVSLGCTAAAGLDRVNTTAGVTVPVVLSSATVESTAETAASPVQTRTSDAVQQVSLLGGVVKATLVRSVSATSHDAAGFHFSADGTTLLNVVINGSSLNAAPAPNTKVTLPGLGFVVLNEQTKHVSATAATFTVNALHVVITVPNPLGVVVGTNVVVAHALSGLRGPVSGTLDGKAYGSRVQLGNVVKSGPTFLVNMSCTGTEGVVKVNTGVGATVPAVLTAGTVTDTAQGTVGATSTGETSSTVQSLNLLAGLVQATVLKADAHASKSAGGALSFSDAGSQFATLAVAGFPAINASVPPNTAVGLPGLGTLYLHRVIHTANSIEVRMIELVVAHTNLLGLPVGSDIQVAVAEASAH
jgi:hypothetical protein